MVLVPNLLRVSLVRVSLAPFIAGLILASALSPTLAPAFLLNGAAATVGGKPITVQDVYLFRSVQKLREGEARIVERETGENLKKAVQRVIFEEMALLELKGLQFDGGKRAEAEKLAGQLMAKKGNDWKEIRNQYGVTDAALIDILYRMIQVERFLKNKADTLTPVVTEDEVLKYFHQNEARFKGNSLEQLKPSVILLLKKQRAQQGLEEWVKFLKDKYRVQIQLDS